MIVPPFWHSLTSPLQDAWNTAQYLISILFNFASRLDVHGKIFDKFYIFCNIINIEVGKYRVYKKMPHIQNRF